MLGDDGICCRYGEDSHAFERGVAAEQPDHLALADAQVDALQHVAQAIVRVNALEFQHQCASPK